MLELHIDATHTTSASIPVRWCIQKEAFDELASRNVTQPFILIAVWNPDSGFSDKWIVPIDQLVQYISFRSPGKNRIFATIVYANSKKNPKKVLERRYLSIDLFSKQGLISNKLKKTIGKAWQVVDVDHQFFAKKPNRFEEWWVNFWFNGAPKNQCAFRKRRLQAYTYQVPIVLVSAIILSLIRIFGAMWFTSLWPTKGIKWKAVFRPWKYNLGYMYGETKQFALYKPFGSFFWRPATIIFGGFFGYVLIATGTLVDFSNKVWNILLEVLPYFVLVVGLFVAFTTCVIGYAVATKRWGLYKDSRLVSLMNRRKQQLLKAQLLKKHGLADGRVHLHPMFCGKLSGSGIDQIPSDFLSFGVKIQALKAKVCKPFAV